MKNVTLSVAIAAVCALPLSAAQDTPVQAAATQAPATAKDQKPASTDSVEGTWHLTMPRLPGMTTIQVLTVKLNGKKVTGSLYSSQMGEVPIRGDFNNGKLKFSIDIDFGGTSFSVDFEGKLKDGELNGTAIAAQFPEFEWKATRPDKLH